MDIYFITYHPECGETFLSLFPVGEQSIDIIVRAIAKLRLGNYNLRIENGRHSTPKLPEHLRICQCCSSNEVENEVHFLLSCNRYDAIRKSLMDDIISKYSDFDSKIVFLLNSIDAFTCKKLGYFIYEAFALRNGSIDTGIVN